MLKRLVARASRPRCWAPKSAAGAPKALARRAPLGKAKAKRRAESTAPLRRKAPRRTSSSLAAWCSRRASWGLRGHLGRKGGGGGGTLIYSLGRAWKAFEGTVANPKLHVEAENGQLRKGKAFEKPPKALAGHVRSPAGLQVQPLEED